MLQKGGFHLLLTAYLSSLNPAALFRSLPGSCAQGLIWGLLALGVYITYKLLDFADLSVDGSLATGGAVAVMLIRGGMNPWLALIFAGWYGSRFCNGYFTYCVRDSWDSGKYSYPDFSVFY